MNERKQAVLLLAVALCSCFVDLRCQQGIGEEGGGRKGHRGWALLRISVFSRHSDAHRFIGVFCLCFRCLGHQNLVFASRLRRR